jgi:hypothetical protein
LADKSHQRKARKGRKGEARQEETKDGLKEQMQAQALNSQLLCFATRSAFSFASFALMALPLQFTSLPRLSPSSSRMSLQ